MINELYQSRDRSKEHEFNFLSGKLLGQTVVILKLHSELLGYIGIEIFSKSNFSQFFQKKNDK